MRRSCCSGTWRATSSAPARRRRRCCLRNRRGFAKAACQLLVLCGKSGIASCPNANLRQTYAVNNSMQVLACKHKKLASFWSACLRSPGAASFLVPKLACRRQAAAPGALDAAKDLLDKVLIADFFAVLAILAWLGAGVAAKVTLDSSVHARALWFARVARWAWSVAMELEQAGLQAHCRACNASSQQGIACNGYDLCAKISTLQCALHFQSFLPHLPVSPLPGASGCMVPAVAARFPANNRRAHAGSGVPTHSIAHDYYRGFSFATCWLDPCVPTRGVQTANIHGAPL